MGQQPIDISSEHLVLDLAAGGFHPGEASKDEIRFLAKSGACAAIHIEASFPFCKRLHGTPQPGVPEACRTLHGGIDYAGHPQRWMGPLQGTWINSDAGKRMKPPFPANILFRPCELQDFQRILHAGATLVKTRSVGIVLGCIPTGADAERDSPAGYLIERRDLLRHPQ